MAEYIANRTVNEIDEAIRFISGGEFVVLTEGGIIPVPEGGFPEDPKELFGEDFDTIAEYQTFYDSNADKFRLVRIGPDIVQPSYYIPIPEDGGKIANWIIGKLDERSIATKVQVLEED